MVIVTHHDQSYFLLAPLCKYEWDPRYIEGNKGIGLRLQHCIIHNSASFVQAVQRKSELHTGRGRQEKKSLRLLKRRRQAHSRLIQMAHLKKQNSVCLMLGKV